MMVAIVKRNIINEQSIQLFHSTPFYPKFIPESERPSNSYVVRILLWVVDVGFLTQEVYISYYRSLCVYKVSICWI